MLRSTNLLVGLALITACGSSSAPLATAPSPESSEPTRSTDAREDTEAILAGSDLPEALPEPLEGDGLGVTIHRLSNGMTVYISTNRQKPQFNAWIAVRAGSRHDPADSTGLAHYLEHMVFKGTDELGTTDYAKEKPHLDRIRELYDALRETEDEARRAEILAEIDAETQKSARYAVPNEMDQLYASLGIGGVNAFTSHEMTVYISEVPSNRLEAWARVEAERFTDPAFRLFYPELEAVYEEKNRSLDSTRRRISYAMSRLLYPEHPYGTQPTIGLIEHLKTPAFSDMVGYFERWYVPNNMAIVLAGDVDPETAIPVLERAFGHLEPEPLEPPAEAALPALEERQVVDVEAEGQESISLAWHTVDIGHADRPALEVMSSLVSNGRTGILDVELVLSQKVPSARAGASFNREAGHWSLYATARDDQDHDEIEEMLLDVVAKLKAGAFTQEDIDAVVLRTEMDEMRELESNGSRVWKMMSSFVYGMPWPEVARYRERLRQVTREDVLRVANEHLGDDYAVVRRVEGEHAPPKIEKPSITPVDIDPSRQSTFASAVKEMPAADLEPEWLEEGEHFERVDLPAGELIAAHNEINELFTLQYRFERGSDDAPLLCHALDLLERSGTREMSAEELQRALRRMGTSIRQSCDHDSVVLSVSGIDRNLEHSVALLEQWLQTARLESDALKRLFDNTVSRREAAMEEPRAIGRALASYAARGEQSRYLRVPSNATLRRSRTAKLAGLLSRLPDHAHRTSYFGPRSAEAAANVIAIGKDHRPVEPRDPVRYRQVEGVHIYFVSDEVAQSQIGIVMPEAPLPAEDRPLSRLYSTYLGGGMSGLIFQEIREARGLAYSAGGGYRAGSRPEDQSSVIGRIGTQSDKTNAAMSTMLELLHELPDQPQRFAKTKRQLDQRYRSSRIDPRSITGLVMRWDDLGFEEDPRPDSWETIKTLDREALQSFADRVAEGPVIISILGDESRIDMDALAEIGTIHRVKVDELFSY